MLEAHRQYLLGRASGDGLAAAIANVGARCKSIDIAGRPAPYTERTSERGPVAAIASPASALGYYGGYGPLRAGALPGARAAGARLTGKILVAAGVDRLPILFNSPFSCDAFSLSPAEIDAVCALDPASFGAGGFALRGLLETRDGALLARLKSAGFILVPYRRSFLVDGKTAAIRRRTDVRRDAKLAPKFGFSVTEDAVPADEAFERCAAAYRSIYLEKHSALNPHYTAAFFKDATEFGLIRSIVARRPCGALAGFCSYFEAGDVIVAGPFGVVPDTPAPVYRMLMSAHVSKALDTGKTLHWGGGVANFKRQRGGQPVVEYYAFRVASVRMRAVLGLLRAAYLRALGDARLLEALDI
jgi:hypothetical protein